MRLLVRERRKPSKPLSKSRRKGLIVSIPALSLWPPTLMRSTRHSHVTAVPRCVSKIVFFCCCFFCFVFYIPVYTQHKTYVCVCFFCRLSWDQKTQRSPTWMASTITVWLQGRDSDPWITCLEERRLSLPWLCSLLFTGETKKEYRGSLNV